MSAAGLASSLRQAIILYLQFDFDGAELAIEKARALTGLPTGRHGTQRIYLEYLQRLFRWWYQQPSQEQSGTEERLHVIGEVTLSMHDVEVHLDRPLRCVNHWIEGCKQWHLGPSEANRFKCQFENIMAQIPRGSPGDANHRRNRLSPRRRIVAVLEKDTSQSIERLISATVDPCVQYVERVAKKRITAC